MIFKHLQQGSAAALSVRSPETGSHSIDRQLVTELTALKLTGRPRSVSSACQ